MFYDRVLSNIINILYDVIGKQLYLLYFVILGCNDNEFTCRNGDCIAANRECDGREDCSDRSDEHSGCGKLL